MAFEVFKKRMVRQAGEAQVTIQREGRYISFNEAAREALGRPERVELLFDREERVMGLRAAQKSAQHAYPVRSNTRGSTHMVAGGLFTRHYGIVSETARRWVARMDGDVLCVDLKQSGVEVFSPQARTKKGEDVNDSSSGATTDPLGRPLVRNLGKVTRFDK